MAHGPIQAAFLSCLALSACATDIPRSRYPEVRAQIEETAARNNGTIVIETFAGDRQQRRVRNHLTGVTVKEEHVCSERQYEIRPDGSTSPDLLKSCIHFGRITAIGDVVYKSGMDAERAANDAGAVVVCTLLLPLCLLGPVLGRAALPPGGP